MIEEMGWAYDLNIIFDLFCVMMGEIWSFMYNHVLKQCILIRAYLAFIEDTLLDFSSHINFMPFLYTLHVTISIIFTIYDIIFGKVI